MTVTAEPRDGDRIEADALDLGERDEFALADPGRADGWRAFVRGIGRRAARRRATRSRPRAWRSRATSRAAAGSPPRPRSRPRSRSRCSALAGEPSRPTGASWRKLCSRVENDWVGAETGLLDQLASLLGERRARAADRLPHARASSRSRSTLGDWQLVTLDSGATHSHAGSGYNERRAECRAACEALGIELAARRDAGDLDAPRRTRCDRRARHVLTENARVDATVAALRARRPRARSAALLDASHACLRDDYEASVPEVEATVERAQGRRRRRRPDGRRRLRRRRARAAAARRRPARGRRVAPGRRRAALASAARRADLRLARPRLVASRAPPPAGA